MFFFNVEGFLRSIKSEIEWTRKADSSRNLENRKAFERACFRVLDMPIGKYSNFLLSYGVIVRSVNM